MERIYNILNYWVACSYIIIYLVCIIAIYMVSTNSVVVQPLMKFFTHY